MRRSRARRFDEEVDPGRRCGAGAPWEPKTKISGFCSAGSPSDGEVGGGLVSNCSKSEELGGGKACREESGNVSGGQLRRRAVKAETMEERESGSLAGEVVSAGARQSFEGGLYGSTMTDVLGRFWCP